MSGLVVVEVMSESQLPLDLLRPLGRGQSIETPSKEVVNAVTQ